MLFLADMKSSEKGNNDDDIFFDKKKNGKLENIQPSLHFYGVIILVKKAFCHSKNSQSRLSFSHWKIHSLFGQRIQCVISSGRICPLSRHVFKFFQITFSPAYGRGGRVVKVAAT